MLTESAKGHLANCRASRSITGRLASSKALGCGFDVERTVWRSPLTSALSNRERRDARSLIAPRSDCVAACASIRQTNRPILCSSFPHVHARSLALILVLQRPWTHGSLGLASVKQPRKDCSFVLWLERRPNWHQNRHFPALVICQTA